ncbi:hypothetical protein AB8Z38_18190 [Bradyrhizobium sp. LLZ17]|uniref:Uncharacterized protein n=1 Tax=Bradyrhizobium sp. LLZ17 TaxID=3239388 RepID=A0AB39XUV8_9BRAD
MITIKKVINIFQDGSSALVATSTKGAHSPPTLHNAQFLPEIGKRDTKLPAHRRISTSGSVQQSKAAEGVVVGDTEREAGVFIVTLEVGRMLGVEAKLRVATRALSYEHRDEVSAN